MKTFYMQVTIIQGPKVNTQVFDAIKKFINNTFESKGKRINPVLKFKFFENQQDEDGIEIELIHF